MKDPTHPPSACNIRSRLLPSKDCVCFESHLFVFGLGRLGRNTDVWDVPAKNRVIFNKRFFDCRSGYIIGFTKNIDSNVIPAVSI